MVTRLPDWDKRLSKYIADTRGEFKFEWGINDCVLYSVKMAEAITGEDHYSEYLGYSTREGAMEIIAAHGSLEALISKHFGQSHRNFLRAKRGDLVLVKRPDFICGFVDDSGQMIIVPSEKEGLMKLPLKMAWRIWSY